MKTFFFFRPPAPPHLKVVYELRGALAFYRNGCFLISPGSTLNFVVNIEIGDGGRGFCAAHLQ